MKTDSTDRNMKKMKQNKCISQRARKAQIETMGLLVVVILVSLILFFVLSFNINKARSSNQPEKQDFKEQQAVSNFGTTMLETTDPCGEIIRDVLADCAFANQMSCEGNSSCIDANYTMSRILDLTLNQWGYQYNLSIKNMNVMDANGRVVLSTATGCNDSKNSNKEITPFSTRYGSMSLVLMTCR